MYLRYSSTQAAPVFELGKISRNPISRFSLEGINESTFPQNSRVLFQFRSSSTESLPMPERPESIPYGGDMKTVVQSRAASYPVSAFFTRCTARRILA